MTVFQNKSEGEIVCVCKPKKPCHQQDDDTEDFDDDDDEEDSREGSSRRENILRMFEYPTELEYEKKCKVCRDVGMRWTKCEEDDGCPADGQPERCDRRRPGRNNRRNGDRRRDRPRNGSNRRDRPSQLRSGGFA